MSDKIPEEIVVEILSRLPAKSLVRFRCVSKSWFNLISSPNFINAQHARTKQAYLLFRQYSAQRKEHYSLLRDNDPFDLFWQVDDFPFKNLDLNLDFIGSINGLICLSSKCNSRVILWNMSIKKYVALPSPKTHGKYMSNIGFGFHAPSDDYKVVRVVYLLDKYAYPEKPKVEIFSLKTMGCGWRSVSAKDLRHVVYRNAKQVLANGNCHWFAYEFPDRHFHQNLITYFDVDKETFGEIRLRADAANASDAQSVMGAFGLSTGSTSWGIVEYKGLLAMIEHELDKKFSLWAMEEYGVVESWTKLFSINLQVECCRPIGFRKNGEVLVFERESMIGVVDGKCTFSFL